MRKAGMLKKGILLILISFVFGMPQQAVATETVDINYASYSELQKITGVGAVIAQRIIEARPYESLDELKKVKGIGDVVLLRIKQQGIASVSNEVLLDEPTQLNEVFTGPITSKSMAYLLNKEVTDYISQEELDSIDTINLAYYEPFDTLEGFQYLHNLIFFDGYSLGGISWDNSMAESLGVSVGEKGVTDLTPLENLKKLQRFSLIHGEFKDLSKLSKNKDLEYLNVDYNTELENISGVENFPELKELSLRNIRTIEDYTPIKNLNGLERLELISNELEDISFLANLYELTNLNLANNKITSIRSLTELTKLTHLNLGENSINQLTDLKNSILIEDLYVGNNHLESLRGIESMEKLACLNASNNKIRNLNELEKLTQVTLILNNNQLTDISGLRNLQIAEELILSSNQISDIKPLSKLSVVNHFILANNNISDVSPLQNMEWVGGLVLTDNPIDDLSPVSHLSYYY